jgi:hypothetical protein
MLTTAALNKLHGVNPKKIILLADYDLTLADKLDKKNPDYSPMTPEHYVSFRDFCERIGHPVIITARGEGVRAGLFHYMGTLAEKYGRIPNLEVASNSGHFRHYTWLPRPEEIEIIDVPGMERQEMLGVVAEIHGICQRMQQAFKEITASDARELCGAIVAKFDVDAAFEAASGELTSRRHQGYLNKIKLMLSGLPNDMGDRIELSSKYWAEDRDGNKLDTPESIKKYGPRFVTKGYTDFLPKGMSKGVTAPIIFNDYASKLGDEAFLIAAGDSRADFDIFTSVRHLVPPERRLFISVGNGLVPYDDKHAKENGGERLVDIVLTKGDGSNLSAVEQMHALLGQVGRNTKLDRRGASSTDEPQFNYGGGARAG